MRKLSDLIADIKQEIAELPATNQLVLNVLGFEIQQKVQSMIGTKQVFWADLKPSTVETKKRKHWGKNGDPASPLYATGEFEKSIEYTLVGSNKLQVFSEAKSVRYTEYGTAKMPPRPVFKPAALLVLRKFLGGNELSKFYLKSFR